MREPYEYTINDTYVDMIKQKVSKQTEVIDDRDNMNLTERWFVEQRNFEIILNKLNNLK